MSLVCRGATALLREPEQRHWHPGVPSYWLKVPPLGSATPAADSGTSEG